MSIYAVVEPVALASAFAISAWVLAGRIAPRARAGVQGAIAARLASSGRPPWMQRLGARWAPTVVTACGDGCTQCGSCGPSAAPQAIGTEQKIVWLQRD